MPEIEETKLLIASTRTQQISTIKGGGLFIPNRNHYFTLCNENYRAVASGGSM
jgi:hypothetical protein